MKTLCNWDWSVLHTSCCQSAILHPSTGIACLRPKTANNQSQHKPWLTNRAWHGMMPAARSLRQFGISSVGSLNLSSDDSLKGNSAMPRGWLKSKPAWSKPSGGRPRRLFFCLVEARGDFHEWEPKTARGRAGFFGKEA